MAADIDLHLGERPRRRLLDLAKSLHSDEVAA